MTQEHETWELNPDIFFLSLSTLKYPGSFSLLPSLTNKGIHRDDQTSDYGCLPTFQMMYHMTLIPAHTPIMRYMTLEGKKLDTFRQEKTIVKRWNNNNTSQAYVVFNSQQQMYLTSSSIWSWKIEKSTATFRCWSFCTAILTICESFQWNLYMQIIKQKVFPPATRLQKHFLF